MNARWWEEHRDAFMAGATGFTVTASALLMLIFG